MLLNAVEAYNGPVMLAHHPRSAVFPIFSHGPYIVVRGSIGEWYAPNRLTQLPMEQDLVSEMKPSELIEYAVGYRRAPNSSALPVASDVVARPRGGSW